MIDGWVSAHKLDELAIQRLMVVSHLGQVNIVIFSLKKYIMVQHTL
jgi:hypothetical protein